MLSVLSDGMAASASALPHCGTTPPKVPDDDLVQPVSRAQGHVSRHCYGPWAFPSSSLDDTSPLLSAEELMPVIFPLLRELSDA